MMDAAQEVSVYPNPTTGIFTIDLSTIHTEATITITDIAGRVIASKILPKAAAPVADFDLGNIAKGLYMIQVRDGDFSYRTKIIIE
jgi:hypothetical protein